MITSKRIPLFILFIINFASLHLHAQHKAPTTPEPSTPTHHTTSMAVTVSKYDIPNRIQQILDKYKVKKLDNYVAIKGINLIALFLIVFVVSIVAFIIFLIKTIEDYKNAKFFYAFTYILFIIAVVFSLIGVRNSYHEVYNPGCYAFTHTAMLFVSPGKGNQHTWIPYQDIKLVGCNLPVGPFKITPEGLLTIQPKESTKHTTHRIFREDIGEEAYDTLKKQFKKLGLLTTKT